MTEIELLRSLGSIKNFSKEQTVFSQYDAGEEMYVVLKGVFGVYINMFTGFPSRVAGIEQGSFFGEMAIIDGSPRSATIVSEEDGAVAVEVIGRGNFRVLIENAPSLTSKILGTLQNRVKTTAEAVRSAGKKVPALPPFLPVKEYKNADSLLRNMTMLADSVRKMNSLLAEEVKETQEVAGDEPVSRGSVRLLPDDYVKYNVTDHKNNNDTFRALDVVCPYCLKSLKAYIPIYSHLGDKRETLDGRVIYSNLNILLYTNTVCPNCSYTDTYLEYTKPRKAAAVPKYDGNQFENDEGFTGYERSRNRTVDEAILSYYLNIDCLKRTSNDPLRFANAWIRLYWLYSDQGSKELARHSAMQARHYYSRYSEQETVTMSIIDKLRLNAILGEMSVVLGEYSEALDYYTVNTDIGKGVKNDLLQASLRRCKELKKLL